MASRGSPAPHREPPGEKKTGKTHHQQQTETITICFQKFLLKAHDYQTLADKENG